MQKNKAQLPPIVEDNKELECMDSAKLLGVTISNNFTWNEHIDQAIKKASERMYFLIQLQRAKVPWNEIILFYTSCIRSVLTYASLVFFYVLPMYLRKDLKRIEKQAFAITVRPLLSGHTPKVPIYLSVNCCI